MDPIWWAGQLLALFGIAAGALLGALMLLHPEWAGPIADVSAAAIVLCLVVAMALLVWPRRMYARAGDGASSAEAPTPVGRDLRRGIFNDAPNHGQQVYNEAPPARAAPQSLSEALRRADLRVVVQIRVQDQSFEARQFGDDLGRVIRAAGMQVASFGTDDGSAQPYRGVVVEPTDNADARYAAEIIVAELDRADIAVDRQEFPAKSDLAFVRIRVGSQ